MRETEITVPELMLVAGTRAMLGAGLGLLFADRMSDDSRRAIGWTLFAGGAVTTIPLARELFGGNRLSEMGRRPSGSHAQSSRRREEDAFVGV